jgi:drug/metabolite transporter, DME family
MPQSDRPANAPTLTPAAGMGIVLLAAALFGTLGPSSRFAYDAGMEPVAFVTWRALIGVFATLAFIVWRVRRGSLTLVGLSSLSRRARITWLVAGLMGFTLNLFMFIAFDRITVALALLGFYTYPAMVAAVNVIQGRERLDRSRLVALGLALAGMVAVVASQIEPGTGLRLDAIGLGLAFAAALSQAVFVVISRDGYRQVPTEQAMALALLVTVLGGALLSIAIGHIGALGHPLVAPAVVPLLLFTGVFGAAIPSLAFLAGLRVIGGTRAGILMLFEPVVGVALAAWLLAESLVPIQLVGAVAILGAAVILQRAPTDDIAHRPGAGDETLAIRVPGGP